MSSCLTLYGELGLWRTGESELQSIWAIDRKEPEASVWSCTFPVGCATCQSKFNNVLQCFAGVKPFMEAFRRPCDCRKSTKTLQAVWTFNNQSFVNHRGTEITEK